VSPSLPWWQQALISIGEGLSIIPYP
jgi:hypothetical protein